MYLIGVIISFVLMRFYKKAAYTATIIAMAMGVVQLNPLYNNDIGLYIKSTISSGFIIGFLVYFFVTMFLLRLVRIRPKFNKYYIRKVTVVHKGATNYSGSNTTITNGTFGGLDARTENYSYNVDTLFVRDEKGKVLTLNEVGKNQLAKIDDEVVLAGYETLPETLFFNTRDNRVYNALVHSKINALVSAIVLCVPLIGHLMLLASWIKAYRGNDGLISVRTNQYDCAHLFFTFVYITVAFFLVGVQFVHSTADSGLAKQYMWMTLPIIIWQYQIVRWDHLRFQKFLFSKLSNLK